MTKILAAFFSIFAALAAAGQAPKPAQTSAQAGATERAAVKSVVDKLFAAMAARDALAAKDVFLPDAALLGISPQGKVVKTPLIDFLDAIGSGKLEWRERIWDETILVHDSIATVWAPYDFHNGGRFSHCGYDSFALLKTSTGWKISYVSDTRETNGCVNPLGPPKPSTKLQ